MRCGEERPFWRSGGKKLAMKVAIARLSRRKWGHSRAMGTGTARLNGRKEENSRVTRVMYKEEYSENSRKYA